MDIKRDDCGMSESVGGVPCNLSVLLQDIFLTNRIQSQASVEILQIKKTKQG